MEAEFPRRPGARPDEDVFQQALDFETAQALKETPDQSDHTNLNAISPSVIGSVATRPGLKVPVFAKAMAPLLPMTFNLATPTGSDIVRRHPTSLVGSTVVSRPGTQPPSPPGSTTLSQRVSVISAVLGSPE